MSTFPSSWKHGFLILMTNSLRTSRTSSSNSHPCLPITTSISSLNSKIQAWIKAMEQNFQPVNSTREKLKSNYIRQISALFRPYLMSSASTTSQVNIQMPENKKVIQQPQLKPVKGLKLDNLKPPPANKTASKSKQKNLERYFQEVNMSVDLENEKIMQQFMDVLGEDQEEDNQVEVPKQIKTEEIRHNSLKKAQKQESGFNHLSQTQYPIRSQPNSSFTEREVYLNGEPARKNSPRLKQMSSFATESKQRAQLVTSNQMMRESIELQNRVKSAIEKSLTAIKKFKNIRESQG